MVAFFSACRWLVCSTVMERMAATVMKKQKSPGIVTLTVGSLHSVHKDKRQHTSPSLPFGCDSIAYSTHSPAFDQFILVASSPTSLMMLFVFGLIWSR